MGSINKNFKVYELCLVDDNRTRIEQYYVNEARTLNEVASLIGCSNNTLMVALGVLGYEVEPWTKERVRTQKIRINNLIKSRKITRKLPFMKEAYLLSKEEIKENA